jgi:hypothetical protein
MPASFAYSRTTHQTAFSPHRLRLIGSTFQFLRQFVQPPLHTVLLDVLKCLVVHSGCSAIGFATFAGIHQNIPAAHLVVQRIETRVGRFLRFCV